MRKPCVLIYWYCAVIFLFTMLQPSQAQEVLKMDTSHLTVTTITKSHIEDYKTKREFQYEAVSKKLSAWDRFWIWLWDWISRQFDKTGVRVGTKIIFWTLVVGIMSFAIVKIVGMEKIRMLMRGERSGMGEFTVSEEDIHGIDFNKAIARAVSEKDFREAVRLLYLQSLKQLSDKSLINWASHKTNIDYSSELSQSGHLQTFNQLTRFYEYAWYGEFIPTEEDYNKIAIIFHHFNQNLG